MKSFWIILFDQWNVVKFTRLIFKIPENKKCYVRYAFWKVLRKLLKLFESTIPAMLQTFFTRRALKGRLSNRRALQGYLGTQGTGALGRYLVTRVVEAPDTRRALGDSVTWTLGHLRHFIWQTPFLNVPFWCMWFTFQPLIISETIILKRSLLIYKQRWIRKWLNWM